MRVIAMIFLFLKWKGSYAETTKAGSSDDHTWKNQNQPEDYCSVHPNHFLCESDDDCLALMSPNGTKFYPKHSSDKEKIVRSLNELRAKVASGNETCAGMTLPQASDMLQLKWDSELERASANIVRRCHRSLQFQFCCRCNEFSRFEANLVRHSFLKDEPIPEWKHFFNFLKSDNEDQFDESDIKNLSQPFLLTDGFLLLIRGEVSLVGCKAAVYASTSGGFIHSFVCVLGGISKWSGFPVYSEGTPCSQCPFDSLCSKEYQVLCSCVKKCELPPKSIQSLSNNVFSYEAETWLTKKFSQYQLPNSTCQGKDFYYDCNDTLDMFWAGETIDGLFPWSQNKSILEMNYCLMNKRHFLCPDRNKLKDEYCPERKKIFPQTEYDRRSILNVFNEYRMQVANGNETFFVNEENITLPSAANFMELQWDYELEAASRNLVELCQIRSFEFCCECNKFDRFSVTLLQLKLINDNVLSRHWPSWDYFIDVLKQNYLSSFSLLESTVRPILPAHNLNQFGLMLSSEISLIGCSVAMYYVGYNYVHHPVCVVAGLSGRENTISYLKGFPCTHCSNSSTCSESYPGLCKIKIQVSQHKSKTKLENKELKPNHKNVNQFMKPFHIEYTYDERSNLDEKLSSFEDDFTDLEKESFEIQEEFLELKENDPLLLERSIASPLPGTKKRKGSLKSGESALIKTNNIENIIFILLITAILN